mmetsp:Transcript_35544/g.106975  ORF Transcript_35544/g.106975 Transcript_35544/m.106975 type:complete len:250 (+) Transcript_35544:165-914(+)
MGSPSSSTPLARRTLTATLRQGPHLALHTVPNVPSARTSSSLISELSIGRPGVRGRRYDTSPKRTVRDRARPRQQSLPSLVRNKRHVIRTSHRSTRRSRDRKYTATTVIERKARTNSHQTSHMPYDIASFVVSRDLPLTFACELDWHQSRAITTAGIPKTTKTSTYGSSGLAIEKNAARCMSTLLWIALHRARRVSAHSSSSSMRVTARACRRHIFTFHANVVRSTAQFTIATPRRASHAWSIVCIRLL